jgi:hypothetical protein
MSDCKTAYSSAHQININTKRNPRFAHFALVLSRRTLSAAFFRRLPPPTPSTPLSEDKCFDVLEHFVHTGWMGMQRFYPMERKQNYSTKKTHFVNRALKSEMNPTYIFPSSSLGQRNMSMGFFKGTVQRDLCG